jgi:predicted aspartyl protease
MLLLLTLPVCFAADQQGENLKSLYDAHRWFELRDAVAKGGAPAFYQGVVACALNDLRGCEKKLQPVFESEPHSDQAIEAHRTLASAYLTHGDYKRTLAQVDALLGVRPDDSDASGDRTLLAELARFPDQKITLRHSTVELQDGGLPFSIHGVQATYWFDTGAELSVMSESEAKRFGLSVRNVEAKVGDVNGTKADTRVAIADELSIGSVRLKHVAFLVLSDNQPPFNEQSPGSRGLIGIPVLLALERFAWSADKKFEIEPDAENRSVSHSDLCFDGNHPVAKVRYDDHDLAFILDTGATNTDLYPPFAAAFPELIRSAVKTDSYKMEGVGGARYMEAANLKSLRFTISGFPATLNSTGVLLKPTTDSSKFFAGNLGIDLLQQAHKTTFDFKAMTLTLQ